MPEAAPNSSNDTPTKKAKPLSYRIKAPSQSRVFRWHKHQDSRDQGSGLQRRRDHCGAHGGRRSGDHGRCEGPGSETAAALLLMMVVVMMLFILIAMFDLYEVRCSIPLACGTV